MSFTEVKKNYGFHAERLSHFQPKVTNNSGRTVKRLELVYLDGFFGEVLEVDGIADSAEGVINIDPFRLIRTQQVADNQNFGAGDVVWFKPQDGSDEGELYDSKDAANFVPVGTIVAGADNDYVVFKSFQQDFSFGLMRHVPTGQMSFLAEYEVDEAADGGLDVSLDDLGMEVGDKIVDVWIVCTDGDSTGTLKIGHKDGNDITDAMTCTTANAVTRAGELDPDELEATADGFTVTAGADVDRGIMFISFVKG